MSKSSLSGGLTRDATLRRQALVACLVADAGADAMAAAGDALRALHDLSWLPAAAHFHRIGGYVRVAMTANPDLAAREPELMQVLERLDHVATTAHLRSLGDLRWLGTVLEPTSLPWLVVKGPILSEHMHGGPGLRSYADLDIVVRGRHLEAVADALAVAGAPVADRNWRMLREVAAGELNMKARYGTPIDLHWQLLFRGTLRDQFDVRMGDFIDRARPLQIAGMSVLSSDPIDTVLHLCLHAAMSGGHELMWLKDIERAMVVDPPDWDVLVNRARDWRLGVVVGTMLQRVRGTLGLDVHTEVLEALFESRSYRLLSAAVDRAAPPAGATGRGSPARFMAKAARATPRLSRREMMARAGALRPRNIRELVAPRHKAARGADLLIAQGTDADRAAYFAAVRRADGAQESETRPAG
ncbi:MAG: nucleotidyltransferase family protein [Mycobacteriales bacterium]